MRVAVLRGLRPTCLIFRTQPDSEWDELDYILIEAYQVYEDETSQTTGQPLWLSRSGDPGLQFVIEEYIDAAQEAIDVYDEEHAKDEKKIKGLQRYVRPMYQGSSDDVPTGGLERERLFALMEDSSRARSDPFAGVAPEVRDLISTGEDEPDTWDPSLWGDGIQ